MSDQEHKHLNYAEDIVNAWDTGEPLEALCGYERILIEGQPATGDTCMKCITVAVEAQIRTNQKIKLPDQVQTPERTREIAKQDRARRTRWNATIIGTWPTK